MRSEDETAACRICGATVGSGDELLLHLILEHMEDEGPVRTLRNGDDEPFA